MIKFNIKKNSRGFTLLEALVAISILMVAVVAPITIAQKGLSSAIYTKNQMIASYLVQDAIEYIKNKKDENFLSNADWLNQFRVNCVGASAWCAIDTIYDSPNGVANGSGYVFADTGGVLYKDSNGFYGYNVSSNNTSFKRKINITETVAGVEAKINVVVTWGDGSVDVNTMIYNY
jgi:type II secretory pathway pseudopilin PulG